MLKLFVFVAMTPLGKATVRALSRRYFCVAVDGTVYLFLVDETVYLFLTKSGDSFPISCRPNQFPLSYRAETPITKFRC